MVSSCPARQVLFFFSLKPPFRAKQTTMIPGDDDTRAWSFVDSLAIGWESQDV